MGMSILYAHLDNAKFQDAITLFWPRRKDQAPAFPAMAGKAIPAKASKSPRLKRRGFTILAAEHIASMRTDMDCRVMMSFLKCLAGDLRHF
jgi:hypothetical protein